MSKYTDISARLDDAKPFLQVGKGEHYEINDDKNNVLKMNAAIAEAKGDIDAYLIGLEILLGKEALEAIEVKHPGATTRLSMLRVLFHGAMASVGGVSFEEAEKRFRAND